MIHAGKGMTRDEYDDVQDYLSHDIRSGISLPAREDLGRGSIVGAATIIGCAPSRDRTSPWHIEGQYGFQIDELESRVIPFVPCKGALGFFDVPPEVAAQLREIAASQAAEDRKS